MFETFFFSFEKKRYNQCITPFCDNTHFNDLSFAFDSLYLFHMYCVFCTKCKHLPNLAKAECLATPGDVHSFFKIYYYHNYLLKMYYL